MGFDLFSFPFYQIGWVLRRLSLPDSMTLMEGSDLCICLWSAIIVWVVMKLLAVIRDGDEEGLLAYLQKGIITLAVILIFSVPVGIFTQLQPQLETLQAGNTDPLASVSGIPGIENPLRPSIFFLWFKYLMDCIPTLAILPVLGKGYALTKSFGQDKYGAGTVTAANAICRTCLGVVPVMVVEPLVMNLVQLAGSSLRSLHFRLNFPVVEIVLVICVFLLAKFFASARELKEENQMII